MAKKIIGFIKLQVPAGKANPSPPIGPALGQRGLNIMEFCKAFNAKTQGMEAGLPIPVVITAYADKSFTFMPRSRRVLPVRTRKRSPRSRALRLKKSPRRRLRTLPLPTSTLLFVRSLVPLVPWASLWRVCNG